MMPIGTVMPLSDAPLASWVKLEANGGFRYAFVIGHDNGNRRAVTIDNNDFKLVGSAESLVYIINGAVVQPNLPSITNEHNARSGSILMDASGNSVFLQIPNNFFNVDILSGIIRKNLPFRYLVLNEWSLLAPSSDKLEILVHVAV